MNQVSIGGTEITDDTDTISVTGQFTITCVFDRILEEDGTPLTDEEMLKVGQDYISSENFRIGRDTNTESYFLTDSPQLLTKDVATKLLKDNLIDIWSQDLVEALKDDNPEGYHWQEMSQREIETIEALETNEEVIEYYRDFVHSEEPRPDDLLTFLLELFIEGKTRTSRP